MQGYQQSCIFQMTLSFLASLRVASGKAELSFVTIVMRHVYV